MLAAANISQHACVAYPSMRMRIILLGFASIVCRYARKHNFNCAGRGIDVEGPGANRNSHQIRCADRASGMRRRIKHHIISAVIFRLGGICREWNLKTLYDAQRTRPKACAVCFRAGGIMRVPRNFGTRFFNQFSYSHCCPKPEVLAVAGTFGRPPWSGFRTDSCTFRSPCDTCLRAFRAWRQQQWGMIRSPQRALLLS